MSTVDELRKIIETFILGYDQKFEALERHVALAGAPGGGGDYAFITPAAGIFGVDIDGKRIPILARGDKLSASFPRPATGPGADWSIGEYVRGNMGIKIQNAIIERGTATVPSFVSAAIVDAVRAKSRLVQAGAGTIPIMGKTTLCRIASDATIGEHTEGANDISESIPVLEPVALDPKMLAALIPVSIELVQDSPNLDAALQMSIAAAFAGKIDTLGIATILADAAVPTSGATQATATWAGILSAVGSMLAADQGLPKALIASPADYIARASQLASTAGSWLGAPPVLAAMADLDSSGMADATAILGDFSLGFAIAVRMDVQVELIRWGKASYGSHLLAAYGRLAGYVLQPKALYIPAVVGE